VVGNDREAIADLALGRRRHLHDAALLAEADAVRVVVPPHPTEGRRRVGNEAGDARGDLVRVEEAALVEQRLNPGEWWSLVALLDG
jgi:hypothetical protein